MMTMPEFVFVDIVTIIIKLIIKSIKLIIKLINNNNKINSE